MKKNVLYFALAMFAFFLMPALAGLAGEGPALPPAREVPGITAADEFPNGCVDCHIIRPEINKDVRISTILKKWNENVEPKFLEMAQATAPEGVKLTGKHPTVSAIIKNIPADCLSCHDRTSQTTPPLERMMHLYHLSGGEQNPFMTIFRGECTHCHKLNAGTGQLSVPNRPEK
jgi:hypothetical protein